ncbi:MAG TPA: hypothetical protein VHS58_07790 [Acetobacteraceae bacterium]|jgi:hypothetical protein|nr:hypothetical protein [Acetobacteraceae bacterium]
MTPVQHTAVSRERILPSLAFAETPSPLVLCDRLLTLAQDADRAGYSFTAEQLLHLAHVVLDEKRQH